MTTFIKGMSIGLGFTASLLAFMHGDDVAGVAMMVTMIGMVVAHVSN